MYKKVVCPKIGSSYEQSLDHFWSMPVRFHAYHKSFSLIEQYYTYGNFCAAKIKYIMSSRIECYL